MESASGVAKTASCVQYAAIFDLESWLYLDGLHGIETVAVIFGSEPRSASMPAPVCMPCQQCGLENNNTLGEPAEQQHWSKAWSLEHGSELLFTYASQDCQTAAGPMNAASAQHSQCSLTFYQCTDSEM